MDFLEAHKTLGQEFEFDDICILANIVQKPEFAFFWPLLLILRKVYGILQMMMDLGHFSQNIVMVFLLLHHCYFTSVTDEQLELYRLALVCKSSAITSGVPLESQSETVQRLQTITR
jgi:hypothetical protein